MALGPLGPGPNTLEKRWLRLVGVVPAGLPAQGIPGWARTSAQHSGCHDLAQPSFTQKHRIIF